jgi:hypothetical protein
MTGKFLSFFFSNHAAMVSSVRSLYSYNAVELRIASLKISRIEPENVSSQRTRRMPESYEHRQENKVRIPALLKSGANMGEAPTAYGAAVIS